MIYAKYTTVLKNLIDDETFKPKIDQALSTYPLYVSKSKEEFIPTYIPTREELNNKILNAYKYREIGFEAPGRFLDELRIAMEEIMPRYNQLYFSADQDFNVIYNVDYKKTIDREKTGQTESDSTSSGTNQTRANDTTTTNASVENYNKNVKSDTPQGQLGITNRNIDTVDYADNVSWNHDSNTDSGTATGSSTTNTTNEIEGTATVDSTENEGIVETTKGNFGVVSAQDLILKYRETILNIDQMIINDERIQELFMQVF